VLVALAMVCGGASASAQTGVSDNRVSLPDGPGSPEGIGDDTSVTGNMGAMSHSLSMAVPPGYDGLSPSLGLQYSSAGGPGVVGVGWSIPMPAIERMTMRGVPDYDLDDEFLAEGDPLVYVGGSNPREYRARFEGSFVRYRWYDAGDGGEGYWTAEYPDGRVAFYGADRRRTLEADARVGGDAGTFRYHLVQVEDVWGHVLHYDYSAYGNTSLVDRIAWVFDGDTPRYTVEFRYERRDDELVDATGGFVETLSYRLDDIEVFSEGQSVDRWDVLYEDYDTSGGFSRVSRVDRYGSDGGRFPISPSFAYSSALGEICDGASCERPFVRDLGNIGVDLSTGDPQLIDINGDALPDIVDSTLTAAPHRIFINTMTSDGGHAFARPYDSAVGSQDAFDFSNPFVQMLDVNGDGFTDAVNIQTRAVLQNLGGGDWAESATIEDATLPDFSNPAILETLRFVDIDNDRRIDLLQSSGSGASHVTRIFRNTTDGYDELDAIEPVDLGFDLGTVEVNDINGDGLVDVAQITNSGVRYRLSPGLGQWAELREASFDTGSLSASQTIAAELEDLNGDGFADVALVSGTSVQIWINRSGRAFEALDPITDADVDSVDGASIPSNTDSTTLLFADANGNGSSDVVWVTASGDVTMLELFPVRPNLLASMDNGMGGITTITYGTSVAEMVRDRDAGAPWANPLPFPNIVVTSMTLGDQNSDIETETRYAYHGGFYDGIEKQFRGYETVEQFYVGDAFRESGRVVETYDLGVDDPYTAGPLVEARVLDASDAPLQLLEYEYGDCPVAVDDADALFEVRHWCQLASRVTDQEASEASTWRTEEETFEYDGYGNLLAYTNHGVTEVGGVAECGECYDADVLGEPCGAACLGDEYRVTNTYIEPGADTDDRWLVGLVSEEIVWADAERTEPARWTRHYYDGDAFVGLPLGEADRGVRTRSELQVGGEWQPSGRFAYDAHGNVITSLLDDADVVGVGQRTHYDMDPMGLSVAAVRAVIDETTTLRKDYEFETVRGLLVGSTQWYREGSSDAIADARTAYDEFGRTVATALPGGDTILEPSVEYIYHYEDTHAWMETRTRSVAGGPVDRRAITCMDGRGRVTHSMQELEDGSFVVGAREVFGAHASPIRSYSAYVTDSDDCLAPVPDGVGYRTQYTDVVGRPLRVEEVGTDGTMRAEASRYEPGLVLQYDANDLDPSHPDFDTPELARTNGRDEVIARGRMMEAGGEVHWYRFGYTPLGELSHLIDPEGNRHVQRFDERGSVMSIEDPDRGFVTYEYTASGLLLSETDPTGTVRHAYDGGGRQIETWVDGARDETLTEFVWDATDDCPNARCTFAANQVVATRYPTPAGPMVDWSGYDTIGRLIWSQRASEDFALERTWTWTQAGELLAATYPDGRTVTWEHDAAVRLQSVTPYIDSVAYDAQSVPNAIEYTNGTTLAFERDGFQRITAHVVEGPSETLVDRAMTYDPENRVLAVTDHLANGDRPSADARYDYDAWDRLIEAVFDEGRSAEETITYRYDTIENLIERTSSLGPASPVHDGVRTVSDTRPHAVTQIGDETIEYDAAGRVERWGDGAATWSGFGYVDSYQDAAGTTLIEFGRSNGDPSIEVTFEGGLTIHYGPDLEIRDGVASILPMVVDASVVRHEYTGLATTIYGDPSGDDVLNSADAWLAYAAERDLIEPDEAIARTSAQMLMASAAQGIIDGGDRITWLHRDALGTLAATSDEDGELVDQSLFYPFGAIRGDAAVGGEVRDFTDERRIADVGVLQFPLRDYHVALGRWMQPDPSFELVTGDDLVRPWEAFGAYSYVNNAPTMGNDPDGAEFAPSDHYSALFLLVASEQWNAARRVNHLYSVPFRDPWSQLGLTGKYNEANVKAWVAQNRSAILQVAVQYMTDPDTGATRTGNEILAQAAIVTTHALEAQSDVDRALDFFDGNGTDPLDDLGGASIYGARKVTADWAAMRAHTINQKANYDAAMNSPLVSSDNRRVSPARRAWQSVRNVFGTSSGSNTSNTSSSNGSNTSNNRSRHRRN